MPARVQDQEWTAERAMALPDDGNRYEVLDGELFVTPSPMLPHQMVLSALQWRVDPYVRAHSLGWTMQSPADIVFSPKRLVQPDLFVVPRTEKGKPRAWVEVKDLLLTVEVLSPSTARADRYRKRAIYMDEGVPAYWIIDTGARMVERWTPAAEEPEILFHELDWRPRPDLPPLVIDLHALFDEAIG